MNPEEVIKETHGDIFIPKVVTTLSMPLQISSYGSSLVTGHTYRHVLAIRDPIPYIIFQYTLNGCGEFIHMGKRYDLPPGSAFLTKTPSPCVYSQHPDHDTYHFVFCTIRGEVAMAIAEELIKSHGNILTLPQNSKSIRMLCQHIIDLRASNQPYDGYAESVFAYDFLLTLFNEHTSTKKQKVDEIPEALKHAVDYLHKNFSNPLLDINDLVMEAKISRCHFTRLFRKFYGTSPKKYLLAQRLNAAVKMLLGDRECHLKEIISECGFTSETYFCYAFRKMYHFSPCKYKKLR